MSDVYAMLPCCGLAHQQGTVRPCVAAAANGNNHTDDTHERCVGACQTTQKGDTATRCSIQCTDPTTSAFPHQLR